ncbi:DegT/DnrJ/EryC1/StrS family aminotransferase [Candidatus Woesearchaeota archaeon]|nr:DegT/DnrJ/EryC1/StrS family aminotransferase [Candidatus Woesearchaeota archaeon]
MKNRFTPGQTYVRVSGKVFDDEEINNAIKVAKDGWWTEGEFGKQFEADFKKFMGVRYVTLVNSGSSANLVAVASLTSKVFGDRRLKPGDEFITNHFYQISGGKDIYDYKDIFIDQFPAAHQERQNPARNKRNLNSHKV